MRKHLGLTALFCASLSIAVLLLGQIPSRGPIKGPFQSSELVELVKLDSTIKLDIRYATANNFTGIAVYPEEWWHYNFKDLRNYSIQDIPFPSMK
jgi:D-alanyl-D-alanine dipeptidase